MNLAHSLHGVFILDFRFFRTTLDQKGSRSFQFPLNYALKSGVFRPLMPKTRDLQEEETSTNSSTKVSKPIHKNRMSEDDSEDPLSKFVICNKPISKPYSDTLEEEDNFQDTATEDNSDEEILESKYDEMDYQLISLVENNRLLYDRKHTEYKNIIERKSAWKFIAKSCDTTGKFYYKLI